MTRTHDRGTPRAKKSSSAREVTPVRRGLATAIAGSLERIDVDGVTAGASSTDGHGAEPRALALGEPFVLRVRRLEPRTDEHLGPGLPLRALLGEGLEVGEAERPQRQRALVVGVDQGPLVPGLDG